MKKIEDDIAYVIMEFAGECEIDWFDAHSVFAFPNNEAAKKRAEARLDELNKERERILNTEEPNQGKSDALWSDQEFEAWNDWSRRMDMTGIYEIVEKKIS